MSSLHGGPIPLISAETAQALLSPYLAAVRECISAGWSAWAELGQVAPHLQAPLSKRCRASFVYDHIAWEARQRFQEFENVDIRERRGFLSLHVYGDHANAVLRFKKLDGKKRARNYPTTQQVLFSLQLQLPGWPEDATRLIAGYQLDLAETGIEDVLVTCPIGHDVEWYFAVADEGHVVEMPTPVQGQLETTVEAISSEVAVSTDEDAE